MNEQYIIFILLITWFALLAFSFVFKNKIFQLVSGIFGIFIGLNFAQETYSIMQYSGLILLALNIYLIVEGIFKR